MKRQLGTVRRSHNKPTLQAIIYIWITLGVIFSLLSVFITFLNATKNAEEIAANIFSFPSGENFWNNLKVNFTYAWNGIYKSFFRSILLALIGAFVDVFLGAVLAYCFVYKDFALKNVLFMLFIAVMLFPSIMGMPILVPFITQHFNLSNDTVAHIAYLLPNFAGGQVTALFLFRTFFGQQPKEIYESARVDGSSDVRIFFKITVPLAFPILLYHFVGAFAGIYNDFLWPSLILNGEQQMIIPTIYSMTDKFINGTFGEKLSGAMYSMYVLSSIPLIITSIISMKKFKSGDFAAGMKL